MNARFFTRGRAAFSLVEVALAVGLAAFSLVAVVGLLNIGINASRASADDTKLALIMQDVAARVRAEVASVSLSVDPASLDLTWNAAYDGGLNYPVVGNTVPGSDPDTGKPMSATAYYTQEGVFVKQAGASVPTANFYKAAISILPLDSYPPPTPTPAASPVDYPFLAVTVWVGWPTDNAVNGRVLGAASASKSVFTFYLLKP